MRQIEGQRRPGNERLAGAGAIEGYLSRIGSGVTRKDVPERAVRDDEAKTELGGSEARRPDPFLAAQERQQRGGQRGSLVQIDDPDVDGRTHLCTGAERASAPSITERWLLMSAVNASCSRCTYDRSPPNRWTLNR